MTAVIYYFSGTGNSLYVARSIAQTIKQSQIVNITTLKDKPEIIDNSDTVGIVFPTYFWDMPAFVADFVKRLKLTGKPYVFGIATNGGGPGNSIPTLEKMLQEKGQKLAAGFAIEMVSNAYVGFDLMTPRGKWSQALAASEKTIQDAAAIIGRREITTGGRRSVVVRAVTSVMVVGATKGYNLPRHYKTNERCNGCGICTKVCPTGNIEVVDKKVSWGKNCAYCQACFHLCPKEAVQLNKKTEKLPRYHHPEITVKDLSVR